MELPKLRMTEDQFFAFAVVPLLLLLARFGWQRYVVRYRLTDRGIWVTLFGGLPIAYVASYYRLGLSEPTVRQGS